MKNFSQFLLLCFMSSLVSCGGSGGSNHHSAQISSELTSISSLAFSSSSLSSVMSSVVSSLSPQQNFVGKTGIYEFSYYGSILAVYTFLDDGEFYGLHFADGQLLGHPYGVLSSDNSTNSPDKIDWANFVGASDGKGRYEMDAYFGRIFLTSSIGVRVNSQYLDFTGTNVGKVQKTYSPTNLSSIYDSPLSLTTVAGSYSGYIYTIGVDFSRNSIDKLIIAEDGTFTVDVFNCKITGKLAQHETTSVFDIQYNASGGSCHLVSYLTGIALPLSLTEGNLQLAFETHDLNHSQTAVFILNKSR